MSSSSGRRSSRQKVQATGSAKKTTKDEKESIYLEHACYICGETKNNAKQTIGHIEKAHSYQIPSRSVGCKRLKSDEYEYVQEKTETVPVEYACPSCWFHCPSDNLDALNKHTIKEHEPVAVTAAEGSKDADKK